jgi:hypothetical protein
VNLCRRCGRDFASARAFDSHRVGRHADGRRCLDETELGNVGLALDARGRWCLTASAERARTLFSADGSRQDAANTLRTTVDSPKAAA